MSPHDSVPPANPAESDGPYRPVAPFGDATPAPQGCQRSGSSAPHTGAHPVASPADSAVDLAAQTRPPHAAREDAAEFGTEDTDVRHTAIPAEAIPGAAHPGAALASRRLRATFGVVGLMTSVRSGVVGLDGQDPETEGLLCVEGGILAPDPDAAIARTLAADRFTAMVNGVVAGRRLRVLRAHTAPVAPHSLRIAPLDLAITLTDLRVDTAATLCPLPQDVVRWVEVERVGNGILVPLRVPVGVIASPASWRHFGSVVDRAAVLLDATGASEVLLGSRGGGVLVTRDGSRFGVGHVIRGRLGIVAAHIRHEAGP